MLPKLHRVVLLVLILVTGTTGISEDVKVSIEAYAKDDSKNVRSTASRAGANSGGLHAFARKLLGDVPEPWELLNTTGLPDDVNVALLDLEQTESLLLSTICITLIGSVGFAMLLFYMINQSDEDLQEQGWEIVTGVTSIFCTILIFNAFKTAVKKAEKASEDGWDVAIYFAPFVLALFCYPFILWRLRRRRKLLAACGMLSAHFVGFAGLDAFGSLIVYFWADSKVMFFVGLVVACSSLIVMGVIASFIRKGLIRRYHELHEQLHTWSHQCEHAENEFFGFIMSSLVAMWLRFVSSGSTPSVEGSAKVQTDNAVTNLFISLIVAILLALCMIAFTTQLKHTKLWHIAVIRRTSDLVFEVIAMSIGWLALYAFQWKCYSMTGKAADSFVTLPSLMMICIIVAMSISGIVIILVVLLDFTADRIPVSFAEGLRELNRPCTLALGLAWEKTFYTSIKGIVAGFKNDSTKLTVQLVSTLGLFVLLLPGLVRFMVPQTLKYAERREQEEELHCIHEGSDAEIPKSSVPWRASYRRNHQQAIFPTDLTYADDRSSSPGRKSTQLSPKAGKRQSPMPGPKQRSSRVEPTVQLQVPVQRVRPPDLELEPQEENNAADTGDSQNTNDPSTEKPIKEEKTEEETSVRPKKKRTTLKSKKHETEGTDADTSSPEKFEASQRRRKNTEKQKDEPRKESELLLIH